MSEIIDAPKGRWKRRFSHEELLSIIHYNAETGEFTWLRTIHSRAIKGTKAGTLSKKHGYVSIQIFGYVYKAHRLAWFYMTGAWPGNKIDHRDRVKSNNIFSNIRDVTHSMNMQNQSKAHKESTSNFIGVSLHKSTGKWCVQLVRKGVKKRHYGLFDSEEKASQYYQNLKDKMHPGWKDAADKSTQKETMT